MKIEWWNRLNRLVRAPLSRLNGVAQTKRYLQVHVKSCERVFGFYTVLDFTCVRVPAIFPNLYGVVTNTNLTTSLNHYWQGSIKDSRRCFSPITWNA